DAFRLARFRRRGGLCSHLQPLASWARAEVGHASLGDQRLTERLVFHLDHAFARLGGTLTAIYDQDLARRDAAYHFFENPRVSAHAIAQAHAQSSALRCDPFPFVFVAVDGSSLTYDDPDGDKGLGSVGTRRSKARGFKFMTALAISPDGVP